MAPASFRAVTEVSLQTRNLLSYRTGVWLYTLYDVNVVFRWPSVERKPGSWADGRHKFAGGLGQVLAGPCLEQPPLPRHGSLL